jgi:CHASE3 domain sensor protein
VPASLRSRLRALITVVAVAVITALLLTLQAATASAQARERLDDRLAPVSDAASDLAALHIDQETAVRGYLLAGQPVFLTRYQQSEGRIPTLTGAMRQLLVDFPEVLAELNQLERAHADWVAGSAEPSIADAEAGRVRSAEEILADKVLFDEVRRQVDELDEAVDAQVQAASEALSEAGERLWATLIVTAVLVVLLMAVVHFALRRWVLDPVDQIAYSVRQVAADGGGSGAPVSVTGPTEVAALGRDIEGMRVRLVDEVGRTERAVQGLRQSGPAVVALRDALAPTVQTVPGLTVAGRLEPAEGVLAGDWYDVLALDSARLAVVVGDVAGHGPAAGVFALRLKQLLTAALADGRAPDDALEWVSRRVGDVGELFATVLVLVVCPQEGVLVYANAGHPAAVLVAGGAARSLPPTGPLLSDIVCGWTSARVRLAPGAFVVVHTDGVVEARSDDGTEYGEDRLRDVLAGLDASAPDDVADALLDDVRRHSPGRPADDRTAVVVRLERS